MVLCKFICHTVEQSVGQETARLSPVTADCAENKTFSKWTPSGSLSLTITNPDVFGYFKPGRHYLLNIQAVPDNIVPLPQAA